MAEAFLNEIVARPVPLDMRILKEMKRSSLGLDLYMWLSHKTFTLYSQGKKPEQLPGEFFGPSVRIRLKAIRE